MIVEVLRLAGYANQATIGSGAMLHAKVVWGGLMEQRSCGWTYTGSQRYRALSYSNSWRFVSVADKS